MRSSVTDSPGWPSIVHDSMYESSLPLVSELESALLNSAPTARFPSPDINSNTEPPRCACRTSDGVSKQSATAPAPRTKRRHVVDIGVTSIDIWLVVVSANRTGNRVNPGRDGIAHRAI